MRVRGRTCLAAVILVGLPGLVAAQPLGLGDAVRQALAQDPLVAAAVADREAATVGIDVARQVYRPRIDALAQVNRATHNNVSGLLFPQAVVSPISGPPSPANSAASVWGTALGTLVSWQPIDFGARRATIEAARANQAHHLATEAVVRLDRAAHAADAYLSVLAAEAALAGAGAAEARARVFQSTVDALVEGQLRPGLDAATARAELAAATQWTIQARGALAAARAHLAAALGAPVPASLVVPAPPPPAAITPAAGAHPALAAWQATAGEAEARREVARRSADPVVSLQGTVYGRGTGVLDDNTSAGGADGLGLEAYNWAIGVTASVPLMEWLNKRDREAAERLRIKAADAHQRDVSRELDRRVEVARVEEDAARAAAAQAAIIVDAARQVAAQAQARYAAGLSSITDVADAERRRAQAEIDAGLSGLAIWRARLGLAYATADSAEAFLRALP